MALIEKRGGKTFERTKCVCQNLDTKMIRDAWQISGFDCRIRLRVTVEGADKRSVLDRLLSIGRGVITTGNAEGRGACRSRWLTIAVGEEGGKRKERSVEVDNLPRDSNCPTSSLPKYIDLPPNFIPSQHRVNATEKSASSTFKLSIYQTNVHRPTDLL